MKLAKRVTERTQIIAFKDSYHGSTQGALSIIGDEYWRNAFRPLLPDILHLDYNSFESLDKHNRKNCVRNCRNHYKQKKVCTRQRKNG